MRRLLRRLIRDRKGGTGVIVAGAMPALIGATAFAVDLGSVELQRRQLQGVADDAALMAAANLSGARGQATAAVAQAGMRAQVDVATETGIYDVTNDLVNGTRFVSGGADPNAVRVTLSTTAPTFFAAFFGTRGVAISRSAVAARMDQASFTIGSRLAALDGGLLNAYLGGLTGGHVSLSVMDYQALAAADVDLVGFTDALRVTADLGDGSRASLLDTQITGAQALSAAANATTNAAAATALRALAAACSGPGAKLSPLIDLGALGDTDTGGTGLIKVNALQLATALAQQTSGTHTIDIDLGASVAGLTGTTLKVALGERPQSAPWITLTGNGQPIVRTAQARVYLRSRVSGVALTGITGLADIDIPIFTELAGAEARLSDLHCAGDSRRATLEARTAPAIAALASADTSRFSDFSRAVPLSSAKIVDTLLVDVNGYAKVDLGQSEPWQTVTFSQSDIDSRTAKTISSSTAVQGVAASVTQNLQLSVSVAGLLSLNTGSLAQAVGSQLQTLAPTLDGIVNLATGAAGVHYGQADLWVTAMRCGQPTLVG